MLGINLIVKSAVMLYFFVTIGKTFKQSDSTFSKMGFSRLFLVVLLNLSASTALLKVYLEHVQKYFFHLGNLLRFCV